MIKDTSKTTNVCWTRLNNEPFIKIYKSLKPLLKYTNKLIYYKLLCNQIKPPTAIEKWINMFPFLETED